MGTGRAGLSTHPSREPRVSWEGSSRTFLGLAAEGAGSTAEGGGRGDTAGIVTAQVLPLGLLRSKLHEKLVGNSSNIPGREQPFLRLLFYFISHFPHCACRMLQCGMGPVPAHPGGTALVPVQVDLADLLTSLGGGARLCPLSFSLCIMTVSTLSPNTLDLPGTGGAC